MLKHFSAVDLGGIVARGGCLEIDGAQFSALDIGGIAARLSDGATLKVHNGQRFSSLDLGGIAARAPGKVTFC